MKTGLFFVGCSTLSGVVAASTGAASTDGGLHGLPFAEKISFLLASKFQVKSGNAFLIKSGVLAKYMRLQT